MSQNLVAPISPRHPLFILNVMIHKVIVLSSSCLYALKKSS